MPIVDEYAVDLKAEVGAVLSAAGGSVDQNDAETFFTEAAGINPFSKHKPVVLKVDFCQDIDSSEPNYDADWWTGASGNCGLTPKNVSSYTGIPGAMDGGMNGWEYDIPDGTSSRPMRLGDFRRYYTDALPPLEGFTVPARVSNEQTSSVVTGMCMLPVSSDYQLSYADFPSFRNYYFGMYLVELNGTQRKYATSESTLGNDGTTVIISSYGMNEGKWRAYPFICTAKQTGVTNNGGTYYTLPMNNYKDFEVIASYVSIHITAEKQTSSLGNLIAITVDVTSSGGPSSFSNCAMHIRFASSSLNDPFYSGEIQAFSMFPSSFTVTSGVTKRVYSGSVSINNATLWANPKVWVTLNNGAYVQGIEPMKTPDDQL